MAETKPGTPPVRARIGNTGEDGRRQPAPCLSHLPRDEELPINHLGRCVLELLQLLVDLFLAQRYEPRLLGDGLLVFERVADEVGQSLRVGERARLHVYEERPRERLVGAVLGPLDARCDAARAAVDLERLERILVLLV